jgi:hypothetical protein
MPSAYTAIFTTTVVSCATFSVHEGKLTEAVDVFDHPFWLKKKDLNNHHLKLVVI